MSLQTWMIVGAALLALELLLIDAQFYLVFLGLAAITTGGLLWAGLPVPPLAAIQAGLYALAVIGVLASVVGAFYYLRIVKLMYFDDPAQAFVPMPGMLKAVFGVSGLLNIAFFIYPAPLVATAAAAAKSLF